jgi:hypothetical protein
MKFVKYTQTGPNNHINNNNNKKVEDHVRIDED